MPLIPFLTTNLQMAHPQREKLLGGQVNYTLYCTISVNLAVTCNAPLCQRRNPLDVMCNQIVTPKILPGASGRPDLTKTRVCGAEILQV